MLPGTDDHWRIARRFDLSDTCTDEGREAVPADGNWSVIYHDLDQVRRHREQRVHLCRDASRNRTDYYAVVEIYTAVAADDAAREHASSTVPCQRRRRSMTTDQTTTTTDSDLFDLVDTSGLTMNTSP